MIDLQQTAQNCLRALISNHKKISFAESCTGGLLSKLITDQSGASEVFECGVVSYSSKIKHKLLNVSQQTLDRYGEVSEQTAAQMAAGVADLSGADIGVGITGIAGPTGATADQKVGLIYVAISYMDKINVYKLELYDEMSRTQRREYTANFVFNKVCTLMD